MVDMSHLAGFHGEEAEGYRATFRFVSHGQIDEINSLSHRIVAVFEMELDSILIRDLADGEELPATGECVWHGFSLSV